MQPGTRTHDARRPKILRAIVDEDASTFRNESQTSLIPSRSRSKSGWTMGP